MENGGQRVFEGNGGEQVFEGEAVGNVAGGEGDARAESGELGAEVVGAGSIGAAAAGEHEVLGAEVSEPASDVSAESAGATGDEDGALRFEGSRGGSVAERSSDEAPGIESRRPERELVFVPEVRECGEEAFKRLRVEGVCEVDESPPALGVLEANDAAEAPGHGLERVGERIGATDGDGAAREEPERGIDGELAESLDEGEGERESCGQGGVRRERRLVEGG